MEHSTGTAPATPREYGPHNETYEIIGEGHSYESVTRKISSIG